MELERKWRLLNIPPTGLLRGEPQRLTQSYLPIDAGEHRIRTDGTTYWETWKSDGTIARTETEQTISAQEYSDLLTPDLPIVTKDRYTFLDGGFTWLVDICSGALEGLVLVELEPAETSTAAEDVERVAAELNAILFPTWLGQGIEVTADARYKTKNLARYGIPPLKGAA